MPKVKLLWHVGPESLPEEKNEYAYENEYAKKHDFMRILDLKIVLVLRTTPPFGHPSNGGEFRNRCYLLTIQGINH